jgi:hypothetical protein
MPRCADLPARFVVGRSDVCAGQLDFFHQLRQAGALHVRHDIDSKWAALRAADENLLSPT